MTEPSRGPLLWSLVAGVVSATLGVAWGLVSGSRAILFDGVSGLVGIAMSAVSLITARTVQRGQSPAFPFGRDSYVPLAIGGQALVRLGIMLFAVLEAVLTILDGGDPVDGLGTVVAYAGFNLLICLTVVWRLSRDRSSSDLVALEQRGWTYASGLVAVMLVGFGTVWLLPPSQQSGVAQYIDPALVVLTSLLILPLPVRLLAEARRELLQMAPAREVAEPVEREIRRVCSEYGLVRPIIRLHKVGGRLYVEVDHVVPSGSWDVSAVDELRRTLKAALRSQPYSTWLNVELSCDQTWSTG